MTPAMWSGSRIRWVAGVVVFGLSASRASAAELDWRGPAVCPDAAELRFRIERAIGMPLSHAAPLRFQVRVEPSARGYVARVEVEAGQGSTPRRRELAAADCSRLADMLTVMVALALGEGTAQTAVGENGAPEGSGADSTPAAAPVQAEGNRKHTALGAGSASSTELNERSAPPAARSASPWWPALSLWFLGDTGSLPRPGTGLALGVQLEREHFQLRALGTLLFEQHHSLAAASEPAPGANLGLASGALSACAAPWGASSFSAHGCAGWEFGSLWGEGSDVLRPRTRAALWTAPRLDVGASWRLGATGLRLAGMFTLLVPLAREDFVLSDLGSVHRPAAAVGRAALGVDWAFE
jgi:hypothetical protein